MDTTSSVSIVPSSSCYPSTATVSSSASSAASPLSVLSILGGFDKHKTKQTGNYCKNCGNTQPRCFIGGVGPDETPCCTIICDKCDTVRVTVMR